MPFPFNDGYFILGVVGLLLLLVAALINRYANPKDLIAIADAALAQIVSFGIGLTCAVLGFLCFAIELVFRL